jgi:hypothetical protein
MNTIALIGSMIGLIGFFGIIYYLGKEIEKA